jgi:hypothetical protein
MCPCGSEVTRPHGTLCECCRKKRQGHGKNRNGGRPPGVRETRQRKPLAPITGIEIPCLCCGEVFVSEHKGNRMCHRCLYGNRNADYIGLGREPHRPSHRGAI